MSEHEIVLTHPLTGAEYLISDGISNGRTWGTYIRNPNGSLRRLCSHRLPLRDNPADAEADLRAWIAGGPGTRTEKARYGEPAREGGR